MTKPEVHDREILRVIASIVKTLEGELLNAIEAIEHHEEWGFQHEDSSSNSNRRQSGSGSAGATRKVDEIKKELKEIEITVASMPIGIYNWIEGTQEKIA